MGHTDRALKRLEKAFDLFQSLGDKLHLAQTRETRAWVFLAENDLGRAETFAAAVDMLREGDNAALLASALTTLGRVRARKGARAQVKEIFAEARAVADLAGAKRHGARVAVYVENLPNDAKESAVLYLHLLFEHYTQERNSPGRTPGPGSSKTYPPTARPVGKSVKNEQAAPAPAVHALAPAAKRTQRAGSRKKGAAATRKVS
jgi:hypothetical protein